MRKWGQVTPASRHGRVEARLTVIGADLRRFYQILGEHTGQIDILKGKQQ